MSIKTNLRHLVILRKKKLCVSVQQWLSFCRTFNANVVSIYAADNIRKIPSFTKNLSWSGSAPQNITNLIHYFSNCAMIHPKWKGKENRTTVLSKNIWTHKHSYLLTFRHRASCILGQAFHYTPENAFYIFNQQIYFIIWYLLDRASLI